QLGLGRGALVRVLRPLLSALSSVSDGCILADGLLDCGALASCLRGAAGGGNGELMPLQLGPESSDMIASLWTTDPLIAANLEAAYGQYMLGAAAPASKGNATGLSADVKKELADEMKNEIAAEKDAAANGQKDAPS